MSKNGQLRRWCHAWLGVMPGCQNGQGWKLHRRIPSLPMILLHRKTSQEDPKRVESLTLIIHGVFLLPIPPSKFSIH